VEGRVEADDPFDLLVEGDADGLFDAAVPLD
jgi:hypothetical protein